MIENQTAIVSIKTPKIQFIENVQRWVLIDSQLKIVNEKTKALRNRKNDLSKDICEYMVENKLVDKKIGIKNGELRIYEKKEYSPLTFGYIEKSLADIVPDKTHRDYIIKYLKENREIKLSHDIRSTYTE